MSPWLNSIIRKLITQGTKSLDKGGFTDILMTELSEAFNWIDHELLIAKMHECDFDIEPLKFTNNHLAGRKERLK